MRAITVTIGLVLAAGSLAVAGPALADAATTPTTTAAPSERDAAAAKEKRAADEAQAEKILELKKRISASKDADERKRLEAALAAQVRRIPVGGADTGLADVSVEDRDGVAVLPVALGGLALAGAAGTVVVARRRRRWVQPV